MKIVLMMAMTADGIMAKNGHHLPDWTSPADKKSFVQETKKHGVIIMGKSTFLTIGRPLPKRLNLILTKNPQEFSSRVQPGTLEFFSGNARDVVAYLEKKGYASAVLAGGAATNVQFIKENLVSELLITISPKLFGRGMTILQGNDFDIDLTLIETHQLDENTVQLRYQLL